SSPPSSSSSPPPSSSSSSSSSSIQNKITPSPIQLHIYNAHEIINWPTKKY
ncbi:uncharacterized protein LOC121429066, partial [Lytechinus variegatus]|uniref:uncharacterized protein LOC121429066 n=1 Tax=Lytechinus variegatus TaxID=7654 RepID=UPI001BB2721A